LKLIIKYIFLTVLLFVFQKKTLAQHDSTKVNINYITKDAPIQVLGADGIAYQEDLINKEPSTAALYSAVLPGLGQIYNEKYWKLPLVYGAIGGGVYAIMWNQKNYNIFLEAYRIRLSGGKDDYIMVLPEEKQLISWMDYYRNQRDLSIFITIGLYAFNILDAYVDAHLINFNISDDLALKIEPDAMPSPVLGSYYAYGVKLKFNFK